MSEAEFVVVVEQHDHTLFDSDVFDSEVVVSAGVDTEWVSEQAETSAEPDQVIRGREEPTAAEHSATTADTVVVHGPTFVVDEASAAPEPASVVAAQPMPVLAASPDVLPNPVVTKEPLPDLLPATAGPDEPATIPQPLEPNLFDLYDDTEGNAAGDDATLPADEAATEEPEETPPAASEADPEAAFFTPREPMRRCLPTKRLPKSQKRHRRLRRRPTLRRRSSRRESRCVAGRTRLAHIKPRAGSSNCVPTGCES